MLEPEGKQMTDEVSVSLDIAASPQEVYRAVSDVTRMGEWSPECYRCAWRGGGSEPRVGAKFLGWNRVGPVRWVTQGTVVAAAPGREFTFESDLLGVPIARWAYRLEPLPDGGTRVTETWTDRRSKGVLGRVTKRASAAVVRTPHDARDTPANLRATLERLKSAVEPQL